jgi:hypothetical protein
MTLTQVLRNVFRGLGDLSDEVSRPVNLLLAFCLSPLPRRYWWGAAGAGILLSGFVQVGASLAGLLHVYTAYAQEVSERIASATITAAVRGEAERVSAAPAMAFGALTPFGFFASSLPAWFFAYGLLSGVIRVLGYASEHPCGDPLLTFVDELVWDSGRGILAAVRGVRVRLSSFWNR